MVAHATSEGSQVCPECRGDATVGCPECKGRGKTGGFLGLGARTCNTCGGSGARQCEACDGTGAQKPAPPARMSCRDFLGWLRGHFELGGSRGLTKAQARSILQHLRIVDEDNSGLFMRSMPPILKTIEQVCVSVETSGSLDEPSTRVLAREVEDAFLDLDPDPRSGRGELGC